MAQFYFHICDGQGAVADEQGVDFSSVEEAIKQARRSAVELLAGDILAHRSIAAKRIEITNAAGDVVSVVRLKDMVH